MSDERGKRPPVDEQLSGEVQLSRVYQHAEEALPPARLDALVLESARKAVQTRSRKIYRLPQRKWKIPLTLAAVLLLSIGLVRMVSDQPRQRSVPVALSIAPPPPSAPAPPIEHSETPTPQAWTVQAAPRQNTEREKMKSEQTAEPDRLRAQESPAPSDSQDTLTMLKQALPSLHVKPEESRPSLNYVWRNDSSGGKAPAWSSAETPLAPQAPGEQTVGALKEESLAPEAWIAKIKELRRAKKFTEAEENLKAFKQRYPDYPIETLLEKP